ncbi:MAG: transposase [Pirellulaceae bacterium]
MYRVLDRGVGRRRLFDKAADFQACEEILAETCRLLPTRICGFCLMPNHWHLVLWPQQDGELAAFMQRLPFVFAIR